ncbi:MAG TPA: MmgE/PrpD family protein [bacterium]|nr:MmgE/PrpD family protein [bacterium]
MTKPLETASAALARISAAPVPDDAAAAAADRVADCLALCLAARNRAEVAAVRGHVEEMSGTRTSAAVGGFRVPAVFAAFVNGTAAHALGLDDFHAPTDMHPMAVVVPAALAAAEAVAASGPELLRAVLVGYEIACRLGRTSVVGTMYRRGFHPTSVFGTVAAAAAAATVLGLTAPQQAHAMAIAATRAAGLVHFGPAATTKPLQAGWAASAGVGAALLARRDLQGPADMLEAPGGLLWAVAGEAAYDTAPLFAPLSRWTVHDVAYKPYAHSTDFHSAVDTAIDLVREHRIAPQDIEHIDVTLPPAMAAVLAASFDRQRRPAGTREAQRSLPFSLGAALLKAPDVPSSDTFYEAFAPDRLADPGVLRLAALVGIGPEAAAGGSPASRSSASVSIVTRDGRTVVGRRRAHRGSPESPFTRTEFVMRNVGLATPRSDIVALSGRLPSMTNVTELADVLLEPMQWAGERPNGGR